MNIYIRSLNYCYFGRSVLVTGPSKYLQVAEGRAGHHDSIGFLFLGCSHFPKNVQSIFLHNLLPSHPPCRWWYSTTPGVLCGMQMYHFYYYFDIRVWYNILTLFQMQPPITEQPCTEPDMCARDWKNAPFYSVKIFHY